MCYCGLWLSLGERVDSDFHCLWTLPFLSHLPQGHSVGLGFLQHLFGIAGLLSYSRHQPAWDLFPTPPHLDPWIWNPYPPSVICASLSPITSAQTLPPPNTNVVLAWSSTASIVFHDHPQLFPHFEFVNIYWVGQRVCSSFRYWVLDVISFEERKRFLEKIGRLKKEKKEKRQGGKQGRRKKSFLFLF